MGVAEALGECTAALLGDDSTPDTSSPAALQVTRVELFVQLSCYAHARYFVATRPFSSVSLCQVPT
jgi:hypothetical protein